MDSEIKELSKSLDKSSEKMGNIKKTSDKIHKRVMKELIFTKDAMIILIDIIIAHQKSILGGSTEELNHLLLALPKKFKDLLIDYFSDTESIFFEEKDAYMLFGALNKYFLFKDQNEEKLIKILKKHKCAIKIKLKD